MAEQQAKVTSIASIEQFRAALILFLTKARPTLEEIYKFPSVTASGVPAGSVETTAHLEFESVERFSGEIAKVRDELDKVSEGHEVFVVCETDAEVERLREEREILKKALAIFSGARRG